MSPFLEGIIGLAFTFLIIKWLWDGLVKAPQKKFESQIDFLINMYCTRIHFPRIWEGEFDLDNVEREIRKLESDIGFHSQLPDLQKEVLKKVHKRLVKSIEEEY